MASGWASPGEYSLIATTNRRPAVTGSGWESDTVP